MKKVIFIASVLLLAASTIFAESNYEGAAASPKKRGICYNKFTAGEVQMLMDSKVTWGYNWYQYPKDKGEDPSTAIAYAPMIWGGGNDFNEMLYRTKKYLAYHSEVKIILGFNEPEMKGRYGGCDLTPKEAAKKWPELEKLADEYGVELAGPALTWGFEKLKDGKVYNTPESWMDAFIKEYKKQNKNREPRFDYIVLHSYMDYPSAVMWFCDKYSEMYNKKVMLTEFCAWDQDQNQTPHQNAYEQMVTMSQKVEAMDNDPNVASYAWFMSHGAVDKIPYNSIYTSSGSNGSLTELGKVYLFMSNCDKSKVFGTGEIIPAYEYISSSNYNMTVGTKPEDANRFTTPVGLCEATDKDNADILGALPLELGTFINNRFAEYQISFDNTSLYNFNLRLLTSQNQTYKIYCDNSLICEKIIESTQNKWNTVTLSAEIPAGTHIIKICSEGDADISKFYYFSVTDNLTKNAVLTTTQKNIPEPIDPEEIAKNRFFKSFEGCGIQIWQNEWGQHEFTFDFDYDNGTFTVGTVGWWGGAVGCYDGGIPNGAKLDLSKVSKVTFDAKASNSGSIYINFNDMNKNIVSLTKEFTEYSLAVIGLSNKAVNIFTVGGVRDLNSQGTEVTIKNIAFWDSNNNEIVPEYK